MKENEVLKKKCKQFENKSCKQEEKIAILKKKLDDVFER
jgi:hypothetical protein